MESVTLVVNTCGDRGFRPIATRFKAEEISSYERKHVRAALRRGLARRARRDRGAGPASRRKGAEQAQAAGGPDKGLLKHQESLKERRERYLEQHAGGLITLEDARAKVADLDRQKAAVQRELDSLRESER
jgi:hypothetical protein